MAFVHKREEGYINERLKEGRIKGISTKIEIVKISNLRNLHP
jgi:hypothetical protein